MAARVREHAWHTTALGSAEAWPQSLRSIVDMLLSNGFPMVALWGDDFIQIYNDAYANLIGAKHPEALGRPNRESWPEFWPHVAPILEDVRAGKTRMFVDQPQLLNRRGLLEAGRFTNCYSPLRDDTGAVAGVLVTLLETTEQMRSEMALRESESRLRLALDVAGLGTWDWNLDDDTAYLDERAAEILGLAPGLHASATQAQAACVHPDDLARGRAQAAAGVESGEAFTLAYRVVHPDGRIRHVISRVRALKEGAGRPVRVVGTNRDVTVEHEAELKLRGGEERLRTLLQNVRDYAIFMLDESGHITEWSDGAERVIGYGGTAVVGRHVSILYTPEDIAAGVPERELAAARATGRVEAEGWRRRKDGSRFWANEIATTVRDDRGAIIGFTKVSRDLSEQKEMREQREQLLDEATEARAEAEKANRAKDEFLITLSHELRTPLAPILLWARALRGGTVPPDELDHAIEAIVLSAESQLQLIDDLRDLSRLKSGRLQLEKQFHPVEEVARAAVGVIVPAARAKGVTLQLDLTPDLGEAMLDRGRFQQVLWNLLSNAVKFTPEGGRVSLTVRREGGWLEAVVADTGQGIEADFLPLLFQRFRQADTRERRRYGGLGVGLALCRHLVELHGGTVEGRSDGPGCGATFVVRIPWLAPDAVAQDAGGAPTFVDASAAALNGIKVLVVEDDQNMRDVMRWTLERAGAAVVTVGTATEALSMLDASDSSGGGGAPDVLVCDLGLPGMNGYDLIEQVVAQRRAHGQKAIPACAVSAHVRDVDRDRALDAGFDSYLAKPMSAQRLIEAVGELVSVSADSTWD